MTARQWMALTIGVVAGVALAVAVTNWAIDFYGIFRGAKGRQLAGYGDARTAKYLLNRRYVPDNFDSLILGPSSSANWDGRGLEGLRAYNDSLLGGDIVELKAIADQALASSQIRVAILLVHPYMTWTHDFKTVPLTPQLNQGALGSIGLQEAYKEWVRVKLRLQDPQFDAFGVVDYSHIPKALNATEKRLMTPGMDFPVDPIAMQAYRDLEAEFHARNVQIIYVIPPYPQPLYAGKPEALKKYANAILADKKEQDRVIDFTSEDYTGFRSVPGNFLGTHMTNQAAREVVATINSQVNRWIKTGQLSRTPW